MRLPTVIPLITGIGSSLDPCSRHGDRNGCLGPVMKLPTVIPFMTGMGVVARPRLCSFLDLSASSTACERHGGRGTIDGLSEDGREAGVGDGGIAYVTVGEALRVLLRLGHSVLGFIGLLSVIGCIDDDAVCMLSVRPLLMAAGAGSEASPPDDDEVMSNIASSPAVEN